MNRHRSRLNCIMIDCPAETFDASLAFWSEALGLRNTRVEGKEGRYVLLGETSGPLEIRLQKVDAVEKTRFHLDIETDDTGAEKSRLEEAGATEKYRHGDEYVLKDPSGNPFCVIHTDAEEIHASANEWESK